MSKNRNRNHNKLNEKVFTPKSNEQNQNKIVDINKVVQNLEKENEKLKIYSKKLDGILEFEKIDFEYIPKIAKLFNLEMGKIEEIEEILKNQDRLIENVGGIYEIVADKLVNPDVSDPDTLEKLGVKSKVGAIKKLFGLNALIDILTILFNSVEDITKNNDEIKLIVEAVDIKNG